MAARKPKAKPSSQAQVGLLGQLFHADPIDGLGWGLRLHRRVEPKDWPRALEEQVPAEHRAGAEEYLRGIAARLRVLRKLGVL